MRICGVFSPGIRYMLRAPALLQIQRFLPVEQLLAKPLECATSAFEAAPELASDDALN